MKVNSLKNDLLKLTAAVEAGGVKDLSGDIQKVIKFLDGHEDMTVTALCKKLNPAANKKPAKKANELRTELVERYVTDLKDTAGSVEERFSCIISELKGDKQARVKEVKAIATGFMGYGPTAKTRAAMIAEISGKRAKDLRTQHKLDILEKWK